MTAPPPRPAFSLSVVVVNHNYEQYVAEAIESALALRWPVVEVVVVDDGSTDGSVEVIRTFGDRVRLLATENATQRVAANRGFAATTGDVVVFLDSDDVLPPDLPENLARVWGPTVSKVQLQMQRIDADGRPFGEPFPAWSPPPHPRDIRRWATTTTAHPTPPGSGNAYSRWFLERLMPVGPEVGAAADSALLAAAPLLGDVVSLPGVVVGYRRHGQNDSNLLDDPSKLRREVERARARWMLAQEVAGAAPDEAALFRSRELLQLRIAAARSVAGPPALPRDGGPRMLWDTVRSPWQPGPETPRHRFLVAAWCLLTLAAPRRLATRLIAYRFGEGR